MKINTNFQAAPEAMDAEARAAVMGLKDGQKMRQEARKSRRGAQRDQITQMKRVADKMRTIAEQTRKKGFLAAGAQLLNLAAKAGAREDQASAVVTGMAGVVGMINAADPHGAKIKDLEADKQLIETNAKAAGHQASNADEDVQQGQRLQNSMTNLMEKVLDARHRAHAAAIKA
jgi:hypothetical protein